MATETGKELVDLRIGGKVYTVTVAAGTPDEEVRRIALRQVAEGALTPQGGPAPEEAAPAPEYDALGKAQRYGREAFGEAFFGLGDELGHGAAAGMASLVSALPGGPEPRSPTSIYKEMREADRADREAFYDNNGGSALAARLAGAVADPIGGVVGKGLQKGLGIGKAGRGVAANAAARSAQGAVEGGTAGLLSAEDDERVQGAATGAVAGMVMSPILGGLGAGLSRPKQLPKKMPSSGTIFDEDTGEQVPIHLLFAYEDSPLGDFYRDAIGRSFGGAGAMKRQQSPILKAAVARAEKAIQKAEVGENVFKRKVRDILHDIDSDDVRWNSNNAEQFRRLAGGEALPQKLPGAMRKEFFSLLKKDPKKATEWLTQAWSDVAFDVVKNHKSFPISATGKVAEAMKERLELDPNLLGTAAESLINTFPQRLTRYMEMYPTGSKGRIAGDAMMALRNDFAQAAGAQSDPYIRGELIQLKNLLDDSIRAQLPTDKAAEFDDELARWAFKRAFEDSVTSTLANPEAAGRFGPQEWLKVVSKRPNAKFGKAPYQFEAEEMSTQALERSRAIARSKKDITAGDYDRALWNARLSPQTRKGLSQALKARDAIAERAEAAKADVQGLLTRGAAPEKTSAYAKQATARTLGIPMSIGAEMNDGMAKQTAGLLAGSTLGIAMAPLAVQRAILGETGVQQLMRDPKMAAALARLRQGAVRSPSIMEPDLETP